MKNPQLSRQVTLANINLAGKAFSSYKTFLRLLCKVHQGKQHFDAAARLLRANDFCSLLTLADFLSKQKYPDSVQHYEHNQLSLLIRKYPFPNGIIPIDTEQVAWESSMRAERKCSRMNRVFRHLSNKRDPYGLRLSRARDYISYVLGDFSFQNVTSECGFGPGVSVGVPGNRTSLARKMLADTWTVTPSAFHYARAAIASDPVMVEYLLSRQDYDAKVHHRILSWDPVDFRRSFETRSHIVVHNKIAFVAKTALTDRSIAVEPLLNGYLQLGAGRAIAARLRRVGIDIADQSRNQRFAREGSFDTVDGYVTIDLSSASDSICTELCRYLLPPDWFDYLNSIRSKHYTYAGHEGTYERFATMGNGFCFPLETLIFAALCASAYNGTGTPFDFTVYGDDIIVRKSVASEVLDLLRICGFTPNPRKTFVEGPFRESCGADWYCGVDVRPVTLDHALDSVQLIFAFANNIVDRGRKAFFGQAYDFLFTLVPENVRMVRPYKGPHSTAFQVDLDTFMASPFATWNKKLSAWRWKEVQDRSLADHLAKRHTHYSYALLQGALSGASSTCPFAVRRETTTNVVSISHGGTQSTWVPANSASMMHCQNYEALSLLRHAL